MCCDQWCFIMSQTLLEIDELLKYLDHAENELQNAEALGADPETLALQLAQHKVGFSRTANSIGTFVSRLICKAQSQVQIGDLTARHLKN